MKNKTFTVVKSALCFIFTLYVSLSAQDVVNEDRDVVQKSRLVTKEERKAEKDLGTVVVTATKTPVSLDRVTKTVNVIIKEDIEESNDSLLTELLDDLPGIFVTRTGGAGTLINLSVRGASTAYTQFQFNGIPLNDNSSLKEDLEFMLQDLYIPSNISQIEVLKGSNSSLYGSRAIGGVINLVPGKTKEGLHFTSHTEYGGEEQFTQKWNASYGGENFYVNFAPTYMRREGVKVSDGPGSQFYNNLGLSTMAGYNFGKIAIDLSSWNYKSKAATISDIPSLGADGSLEKPEPSSESHKKFRVSTSGVKISHKVFDNWEYVLKGAYTNGRLDYINSWNEDNDKKRKRTYDILADMQHNLSFSDFILVSLGADYELKKMKTSEPTDREGADGTPNTGDEDWTLIKEDNDHYNSDIYGLVQITLLEDMINWNLGGRYVMPSDFDSTLVYDTSVALNLESLGKKLLGTDLIKTKIHGGVSTGYRAPSLFELYGKMSFFGMYMTVGKEDLKPEKSMSYEVGIDQKIMDFAQLGLTWFYSKFEDKIIMGTMMDPRYRQAGGEAYSKGFESYFNAQMLSYAKLRMSYTYTKSEYKATSASDYEEDTFHPKHKLSAKLTVFPVKDVTVFLRASYRSKMVFGLYNMMMTTEEYTEDSLFTLDCNVAYKVMKNGEIYLRCSNLLDKDYTEGAYQLPGREIFGGIKLSI